MLLSTEVLCRLVLADMARVGGLVFRVEEGESRELQCRGFSQSSRTRKAAASFSHVPCSTPLSDLPSRTVSSLRSWKLLQALWITAAALFFFLKSSFLILSFSTTCSRTSRGTSSMLESCHGARLCWRGWCCCSADITAWVLGHDWEAGESWGRMCSEPGVSWLAVAGLWGLGDRRVSGVSTLSGVVFAAREVTPEARPLTVDAGLALPGLLEPAGEWRPPFKPLLAGLAGSAGGVAAFLKTPLDELGIRVGPVSGVSLDTSSTGVLAPCWTVLLSLAS